MECPTYIGLVNGKTLDLINPDPDVFDIENIAGPLSKLCRFAGQTNEFYSVAQHSIWVSQHVSLENSFYGLMHDATEAFCVDLPSPIKQLCPDYKVLEQRIWKSICARYNIPFDLPSEVHAVDRLAVIHEARNLMPLSDCERWYPQLTVPKFNKIVPLDCAQAEFFFNEAFEFTTQSKAA